jgi:hypothetical protein
MNKIVLIFLSIFIISGCASTDSYSKYIDAHLARNQSDVERIKGLSAAAAQGDQGAIMALALTGVIGNQQSNIIAPKSNGDIALQWAGMLLPTIVQGYGLHTNQKIAVTQSNNAAAIGIATTRGFVDIAGNIAGNQTTTTTTTTNSINGNGYIGNDGSYGIDDHTANNSVAGSGYSGNNGSYSVDDHTSNTDDHTNNTDDHTSNTDDNSNNQVSNPVTLIPTNQLCVIDPMTNNLNCMQ